jgi:hypothetical protein
MVRTVLLAALAAVGASLGYGRVPSVHAQTIVQPGIVWGWPYDRTLMQWGYWYSPCYPFVSCWAYQQFQILERRQERFEQLRRGQQTPPSTGTQNEGGIAANRDNGQATRPSNDADVLPEYIDSGRIRDQYAGSGEFLPEFLDRTARPSR